MWPTVGLAPHRPGPAASLYNSLLKGLGRRMSQRIWDLREPPRCLGSERLAIPSRRHVVRPLFALDPSSPSAFIRAAIGVPHLRYRQRSCLVRSGALANADTAMDSPGGLDYKRDNPRGQRPRGNRDRDGPATLPERWGPHYWRVGRLSPRVALAVPSPSSGSIEDLLRRSFAVHPRLARHRAGVLTSADRPAPS